MDKLQIIKEIFDTDSQTDKKILALIQSEKNNRKTKENIIQIDERETTRKPVSLRVNINTGKERITAMAEDVSMVGAFISTNKKINQGEKIAVRLISPAGEEFDFISEVVRVDPSGIGILIKSISAFQEERFHQFVKQL
ncbi:MAG: PilZ domain-containing protein [Desulfotignum sp.]|nr:PilZ domain-containing protein [Desulfotignum sp.]MCF8126025.1 PilZ domain-containing protein [Desulfotignum sp.]